MSVVVDQEPFASESLGFDTVGQVLSHLQSRNRLVVHVLVDGREPSLDRAGLASLRAAPVGGHAVYIETADPRRMAIDVLNQVEEQLTGADVLKDQSAELLQQNNAAAALEKLGGCFRTWQSAQEAVLKTAQLLRLDLSLIRAGETDLLDMLRGFSEHLRQIRTALEGRDYVALSDVLLYEMTDTAPRWSAALGSMRATIAGA